MSNLDVQGALQTITVEPVYRPLVERHEDQLATSPAVDLSARQGSEIQSFIANWTKNRHRYEAVASKAEVPAAIVAALHWREGTGNFNTYLHQGDPLGRPAVNEPKNIPVFHAWEDAAIHALRSMDVVRSGLRIDESTRDLARLLAYAEAYNGFGYVQMGATSPYVYAGTTAYRSGKFVADGRYSSGVVDQQLGVLPMLAAAGMTTLPAASFDDVAAGRRTLGQGDGGAVVTELQSLLGKVGQFTAVDGSFGPGTLRSVKAFQTTRGLAATGVVDARTARELLEVLQGPGTTVARPEIEEPAEGS